MLQANADSLVIRRILRAEKGSNTAICKPNHITMLSDEAGGNIAMYQRALSGEKTGETLILEYQGEDFNPLTQLRVGFGEKLPEIGIKEYLAEIGVPSDEIERVIDVCELRKHLFYTCSQLGSTQARQIELLRVLYSNEKIVILNDPFQPFNGRWREYFAEKLLEDMHAKNRILVVLYLSFVPQSWTESGILRETDVSKFVRPEAKREAQKATESDLQKVSVLDAATLERQAAATLRIPVPEPLHYAYTETIDFIFAPLARLTETFGRYGAVAVMLAMAVLIIMGSMILLPKAKELAFMKQFFKDAQVETSDPKIISTNTEVNLAPEKKLDVEENREQKSAETSSEQNNDDAITTPNDTEAAPVDLVTEDLESLPQEADTQPVEEIVVPQFLQGGPLCLTESDEFNLWYYGEPLEANEPNSSLIEQ